VCINASNNTYEATVRSGSDGSYSIPLVRPGKPSLTFSSCNTPGNMGSPQYSGRVFNPAAAATVTVVGDHTAVFDEELLPGASISGTITDADNNAPVSPSYCAEIDITTDKLPTYGFIGFEDSAGHYLVRYLPGTQPGWAPHYKVEFRGGCFRNVVSQWWDGKSSATAADVITLAVGENRAGIDAAMTRG